MSAHLLPIFPTSGFDRSATTPVFLGLLISWFFTETFGWVFAGLVVPGYLAGVFVLDPRAGVIDVVEGVLTYGLAKAIDELLPRAGLTFRAFGRERFLLVIVSSVIVRLIVDAVVLRHVLPQASWAFSIGLVLVPLMANACWKTGLARGIIQNGVPTALVYLILRFVLLRYTNLSLSGFQLATENVAASFLASPKAYILLMTTAALAAAANVRFGWDFNGILIPALLALVIVEPTKLLATFAEAVVLLTVASLLLRALRATSLVQLDIEGPRRTVFFFALDYALRFAFAVYAGRELSGSDVVELMGFGYLLPTLLAVKMSEYGSVSQVLLPALEVSGGAFVLATVLGFAASRVDWRPPAEQTALGVAAHPPSGVDAATLWASALVLPDSSHREEKTRVSATALATAVDELIARADSAAGARTLGLEVAKLDGDALLVREPFGAAGERHGYPVVVARRESAGAGPRVVALVCKPLSLPMTAAMAGRLLNEGAVDTVVVAGEEGERPSESGSTYAHAVARSLATTSRKGGASGGIVVKIDLNEEASIARLGERARLAPRVQTLLSALRRGGWGELSLVPGDVPDDEAVLGLSSVAMETSVGARAEGNVPLGSPTALALAFEPVRPFAGAPASTPEDVLALRRLILKPLLAPSDGEQATNLLRRSATALGYQLFGPVHLHGDAGFLLLPAADPRPVAVFTRPRGPHRFVLEIGQGTHARLRDVGARLAGILDADSMLLGLEPSSAPQGTEGMRALHALALASPARVIVVLREGSAEPDGADVLLGSWGDDLAADAVSPVKAALVTLGFRPDGRPLDQAMRELSSRPTVADKPLVIVTIPTDKLEKGSLRAEREASLLAGRVGLPVHDEDVAGAIAALAEEAAKDPGRDAAIPINFPEVAARAALEHSIASYWTLATAARCPRSRAALVRSTTGVFLVAVGRIGRRVYATAASPTASTSGTRAARASSLRDCALGIAAGGTCYVEER